MKGNKAHYFWLPRCPALLACFLGFVISAAPVFAGGLINTNNTGDAINGFDPVAYFTMGEAVKGTKEYNHEWLDVTWHFTNEEHRDMFAADPTKYAPQHGGYCSAGAAGGRQYSVDPRAWRILDNKLYLFYDKPSAVSWNPDSSGASAASDEWLKTLADIVQ